MTERPLCTFCLQEGHRASHCPVRPASMIRQQVPPLPQPRLLSRVLRAIFGGRHA